MNLRHNASVHSEYDFVDVENEGEVIETWTYLVYIDKEFNKALEIEFEIHHEPEHKVELVRATTVQYGTRIEPCPMCGTTDMEFCQEFEAEKESDDTEHAFLHECGFTKDEILDLAIEVYIDDNFEDIMEQEDFNDSFVIENQEGNTVYLYETYSTNRYFIKGKNVFHFYQHGEEEKECPFCESKELSLHTEDGVLQKCSVLTKNIRHLKKLIKNSQ
ncbi:hypothetical protein CVD28_02070 [Bacillus sp. M6-12]|uniref:hypothetical protein n=1 Tax=Bacillus sp. M6-12 TaxID=2054166 RepID=UPI000C793CFE|nr:hypothetical protein [Bacillus sp. M6-12]PLS19218.1 hypothetical protein CVD28_02070 [Bacillus sp. M6-12]